MPTTTVPLTTIAKKEFPTPLSFKKLIGPSFIILALGLGSGEVILWPYLVSNYGLGIAWGAILGITFQFFINMEIERYALVKGESVFMGINKVFPKAAYWFILSTFVGFGLPGIIAAAAKVFSQIIGVQEFKWMAMVMLVFIGFILSSGKTVYGLMERLTKTIILIGVPFVFVLVIWLSTSTDWVALTKGVAGIGDNYNFLPIGIGLATFFAAFAYSGAGGNLNLTQSIYVKEKGYGMGKYSQKIAGLFVRGKDAQKVKLTGESFEVNAENISRFSGWWRRINLEHFFVFWFIGSLSMLLLMLLAYSTAYGLGSNAEGINFVINEGAVIGQKLYPIFGILFLLAVSVMLFQTQLGVMDSTSRIMAENVAIKKLGANPESAINLSKIYYFFVWAQIAFGVILFSLNIYEPKSLIVLGAMINAFAMFIHTGLVSWTNYKTLPKEFHPGWLRRIVLLGIFLFFGFFSILTLWEKL
ncbi:MAG: hypothetical protein UX39_C0021G0008 [Candidatus Magasanikbacteria bacterium GW2011_GWA2_46_17]|uniref:Uncharacterized protein n=1 Tax=Candidatus Magasanikbacteria bacterium GW2011_GWA2_46_17 TaxID=1619042 RepID=A0A0G1NZ16_9BACT|nr:MAG: hypothetical protein UX39_C0021G0008 [Candidatus Magasanikbacteria bacterium GW2011_GWA2_46_17]